MPISSFFSNIGNQARRFAGQALGRTQQSYKQLDEQLGGWLPGGGTASPLTRSAQQLDRFTSTVPQATLKPPTQGFKNIPGATPDSYVWDFNTRTLTPQAKEVLRQLGQSPDVTWDINKTNPVAQIGSQLGYAAELTAHANPFKNQIFMPLSSGSNLKTLIHEAGHLDRTRRSSPRPVTEGILGQVLDTPAAFLREATGGDLSPLKGTLAPFRLAGGLLTALSDAKEEDYAEKFTMDATEKMLGRSTSARGGHVKNEPSAYAHNLYNQGASSFSQGLSDLTPGPIKFLMGQFGNN